MASPGKWTQPSNPGEILIELFQEKKSGIFPKLFHFSILLVFLNSVMILLLLSKVIENLCDYMM
jgi:nitrate reductase gamma subunit